MRSKQNELLFNELVERVRKIDVDAAIYLSFDLRYADNDNDYNFSGDLMDVMTWRLTPQDADYWIAINRKLKKQ